MKAKEKKPVMVIAVTSGIVLLIFIIALIASPGSSKEGAPGVEGRKKNPDDQGVLLGLLFGDQWIVVRDLTAEGNGEPIYFSWQWPDTAYNEDGDFEPDAGVYPIGFEGGLDSGCVQPVSFEPVGDMAVQFELNDGGIGYYDSYGRERVPTYLIPLDPECKIPDVYAETWGAQVMEADSGRFNMARSPQNVIDAAYEEVLATCNRASNFFLDAAGRLVLEFTLDDGTKDLKTIDSPLENLALYQKIMQNGCLVGTDEMTLNEGSIALLNGGGMGYLVCGDDSSPNNDDFLRAAAFLAGAGDKTGRVNVDLVIYLNNRLEVNDIQWSENKQEVSIGYFNFQGASYDRGREHLASTADLLQPPAGSDPQKYPRYFDVSTQISIFDKVFTTDWPDGDGDEVLMNTPIINFVRAADDALTIINYLHNYELPVYPLLPVEEPTYPVE